MHNIRLSSGIKSLVLKARVLDLKVVLNSVFILVIIFDLEVSERKANLWADLTKSNYLRYGFSNYISSRLFNLSYKLIN